MSYNPDFFKPQNFQHAQSLILTPEGGKTLERWEKETEWTLGMLDTFSPVDEASKVLDWGCGVGRLSRALTHAYGCGVMGVDLQPEMLELAEKYVASPKFSSVPLAQAPEKVVPGSFSHILCVWVLQHSPFLEREIPLLWRALAPGGTIFVVENITKAIPNLESFYDDGVATETILEKTGFETQAQGLIPAHVTTPRVHKNSWWRLLKRPNKRITHEHDIHH
jgi:2-polyprenyl-3-methyl-5-hydroxy-6-metoxy-1,4-benzoquinol methylase